MAPPGGVPQGLGSESASPRGALLSHRDALAHKDALFACSVPVIITTPMEFAPAHTNRLLHCCALHAKSCELTPSFLAYPLTHLPSSIHEGPLKKAGIVKTHKTHRQRLQRYQINCALFGGCNVQLESGWNPAQCNLVALYKKGGGKTALETKWIQAIHRQRPSMWREAPCPRPDRSSAQHHGMAGANRETAGDLKSSAEPRQRGFPPFLARSRWGDPTMPPHHVSQGVRPQELEGWWWGRGKAGATLCILSQKFSDMPPNSPFHR